ncbi:MAG: NYN domain-containing protein [Pseudomonadota bacterium]
MATAILVDGGFFLKRYRTIFADIWLQRNAKQVAEDFHKTLVKHLHDKNGKQVRELYRILYYDCPPLTKKLHQPISKTSFDASKSREAVFRLEFFEELRRLRKVALRLGHLSDHAGWRIKPDAQKALLTGARQVADLEDGDFEIETRQKGVDMKIGVDIASLAYKRQADQIILVAGDGDFVPAAKLARREGIDFVLDPMWAPVPDDLHEHVDGLQSVWPKPKPRVK